MDWPGLDRWGTSEDDALAKLSSYLPRYRGVAERAGMASAFKRSRTVEVIERVPGSSSTDFWGIAHVPSETEREVLSPADLDRRFDLLRACWAYFDDVDVTSLCRAAPATPWRWAQSRLDHPPHVRHRTRELVSQGRRAHRARRCAHPGRPRDASAGIPRRNPRLQRRGQTGAHLADPVPRAPHRAPRHGSRVGNGGPGPHILRILRMCSPMMSAEALPRLKVACSGICRKQAERPTARATNRAEVPLVQAEQISHPVPVREHD